MFNFTVEKKKKEGRELGSALRPRDESVSCSLGSTFNSIQFSSELELDCIEAP